MSYFKYTSCLFSRNSYLYKLNIRILNPNISLKVINAVQSRSFKTSQQRQLPDLHFLLAALIGRSLRKFWNKVPKDKKVYFKSVLDAIENKLAAAVIVTTLISVPYYIRHLEEVPITKRVRFMPINRSILQLIMESTDTGERKEYESKMMPAHHPDTKRVERLANRILDANQDIMEVHGKQWGVSIVDDSKESGFVLPSGHIVMFKGFLNLCSNDDQLGTALSHEISHCLLQHSAERLTYELLMCLFSPFVIAAIWAVLPSDVLSLFTHILYHLSVKFLFKLPHSRKREAEADEVGLVLAAKACFDVRECSAFWDKLTYIEYISRGEHHNEFLNTHPSHGNRSERLESVMNKAIALRQHCGCPKLKKEDPRVDVVAVSKVLELNRRRYLENYSKHVIV